MERVSARHCFFLTPLLSAVSPSHSIYTSACLLVEINTFLLLLRRKMSYSIVVELPFILSWVLLRIVWYPLLMLYFLHCTVPSWTLGGLLPPALAEARIKIEGGGAVPMMALSMASWAAVCLFQFKWTGQLFGGHPWFGGRAKARARENSGRDSQGKGFL